MQKRGAIGSESSLNSREAIFNQKHLSIDSDEFESKEMKKFFKKIKAKKLYDYDDEEDDGKKL